jgi:hypothetical protein
MTKFGDPTSECCDKEDDTNEPHHPGGD